MGSYHAAVLLLWFPFVNPARWELNEWNIIVREISRVAALTYAGYVVPTEWLFFCYVLGTTAWLHSYSYERLRVGNHFMNTRSIWKMLGPFATTSRLTPIQQMSLAVLSRAACTSMSTTTTTTTTRDRGDSYGPMEWAQSEQITGLGYRGERLGHFCVGTALAVCWQHAGEFLLL